MTNEEAIKVLKRLSDCGDKCDYHCKLYDSREEWCEKDVAIGLAIKALEQQPCEDCISRKRVIMLIDEATEKYPYKIIGLPDTYSNYNQGWTDACDWLYANIESDNLPSVTPQTGWIPVSEQLPKENEYIGNVCKYYLIQDEYGDMHVAHLSNVGWIPMNSLKAIGDEVIAWMPLPQPYKAESEDEND